MTRSNVVPFPSRHDPADHVAESGESILARAAQISVLWCAQAMGMEMNGDPRAQDMIKQIERLIAAKGAE